MSKRYESFFKEDAKKLASSGDLEGITKMISKYWYSNNITLTPLSDKEWSVSNAKGLVNGFHVIKKGNKYIFEYTG